MMSEMTKEEIKKLIDKDALEAIREMESRRSKVFVIAIKAIMESASEKLNELEVGKDIARHLFSVMSDQARISDYVAIFETAEVIKKKRGECDLENILMHRVEDLMSRVEKREQHLMNLVEHVIDKVSDQKN